MNASRRKTLADTLAELNANLSELQSLAVEEQEAFDNMPESLQGGDKGQDAQTAIDTLEQAKDAVQEVLDLVEADKLQEAMDALAEAAGQ